jgi:hypothetical protein
MSVKRILGDEQRAREHNAFLKQTGFAMPPGSDEDFGYTEQVGPYAVYHHLWRYAAYLEVQGQPPADPGTHPLDDPMYREAMSRQETRFDHLLRHTEEGGYYYPIDFPKIITVKPAVESKGLLKKMFGGGGGAPAQEAVFGSAQRLQAELQAINEFLKVPVRDEAPSATYEDGIHGDEWGDEKWSWCVLYFMSRKALEHGQIMVFE